MIMEIETWMIVECVLIALAVCVAVAYAVRIVIDTSKMREFAAIMREGRERSMRFSRGIDIADLPQFGYFSPRACLHTHVKTETMAGTREIYAYCPVCRLQSEPVRIGWFFWVARQRAIRKFYQLSNIVDKEK